MYTFSILEIYGSLQKAPSRCTHEDTMYGLLEHSVKFIWSKNYLVLSFHVSLSLSLSLPYRWWCRIGHNRRDHEVKNKNNTKSKCVHSPACVCDIKSNEVPF